MATDISQAVHTFVDAVSRFEKKFGVIALRPPAPIEPPFPLGGVLTSYFQQLDLREKPETGGSMALKWFPLDRLAGALSGWRWIRDKAGNTVENEKWPTSWIIIADRDGDAVIVDASTADGSVFGSIQMTSFPMADSLASFLIAVAQCMDIEREKYGYEVTDDDFNTIEPYLDDVKAVADEALGGENAKGLLRFFFG